MSTINLEDTTAELQEDDEYRVLMEMGRIVWKSEWLDADVADGIYHDIITHRHVADQISDRAAIERKSDNAIVEGHWT